MKKFLLVTKRSIVIMSALGVAYAEPNSWTGFYAGLDAGLVFNNAELASQQLAFTNPSNSCNTSSDFTSFSPGLQFGYMHQFSNYLVSGVEANVVVNTNQSNTLSCVCSTNPNVYDRFSFKNPMQGFIKGRIGRAISYRENPLLPYLTLGVGFADVGLTYQNEGDNYFSKNTTAAGWLIGTGIEWAFKQHWSLRAEYFYADYENTINLALPSVYDLIDPNGNAQVDLSANNIALALNYWIY